MNLDEKNLCTTEAWSWFNDSLYYCVFKM